MLSFKCVFLLSVLLVFASHVLRCVCVYVTFIYSLILFCSLCKFAFLTYSILLFFCNFLFFKPVLLVTHSLSFCLSKEVFICLLLLKENFAGYRILVLQLIFLQNFEDIIPSSSGFHHFCWKVSAWSSYRTPEGNVSFSSSGFFTYFLFVFDLL